MKTTGSGKGNAENGQHYARAWIHQAGGECSAKALCSSPAESELWPVTGLRIEQSGEPGIAVNLEQSAKPLQVAGRMLALPVLAIDIGNGRPC